MLQWKTPRIVHNLPKNCVSINIKLKTEELNIEQTAHRHWISADSDASWDGEMTGDFTGGNIGEELFGECLGQVFRGRNFWRRNSQGQNVRRRFCGMFGAQTVREMCRGCSLKRPDSRAVTSLYITGYDLCHPG